MPTEEVVNPVAAEVEPSAAIEESSVKPEATETSQSPQQDDDSEYSEKVRKRIARETYHRREAERQRDEIQRKLTEVQATKPASEAAPNAETEDPEPDEEKNNPKTGEPWKDFKEFNRAHTSWVTRHELAKVEKEKAEAEQRRIDSGKWQSTQSKASEKYKDYSEISEQAFKLIAKYPERVTSAISQALLESEIGGEILYLLGQDPAECDRIASLSPIRAVIEIGKLEAVIADKQQTTEEESPVVTTKAPRPPTPVRKPSGAISTEPLDTDDPKTWRRKREAQIRAKNGNR